MPIGRVSATPPPTPLSLTSSNFGVPAGLGVELAASSACGFAAAPDEDALDAAAGALLLPAADAPPVVGSAAVDRFVAVLRFAGQAVDLPRVPPCDEPELGVLDVLDSREEEPVVVAAVLVLVAGPPLVVAELWVFAAGLSVLIAEPLVFEAERVVLVAGLVVAGLVAAGAAAAGLVVAVPVVVVLVPVGAALAELVVGAVDGDVPCCCCATQVSYELIRDHSVQCAVLTSSPCSS